MTKTDTAVGLIIGFLIGLFFFIALKTLQIQVPQSWLIIVVCPPLSLLGLFAASAIGKKFLAVYQMAKFLLVGALNTFLDLAVLNFLMWVFGIYAGVFFAVFKGTSFLAAATNSYFWNKLWTFGGSRSSASSPSANEFGRSPAELSLPPLKKRGGVFAGKEYLKFLAVVGVGLLINVGAAGFVVNVVGPQFGIAKELWANVGAFFAAFTGFIWNFIGTKLIVFKK